MAEKVKLSKDGNSIDFVQSDNVPTSLKKFRQSPEIEGFYRFIFENDLQKEAFDILDKIIADRKAKKTQAKKEQKEADAAAQLEAKKAAAQKNQPASKTQNPKELQTKSAVKPVQAAKASSKTQDIKKQGQKTQQGKSIVKPATKTNIKAMTKSPVAVKASTKSTVSNAKQKAQVAKAKKK